MKKRFVRAIALVCILVSIFSVTAIAAEEASYYFSNYSASATDMGGGRIAIDFDVLATGIMEKVGAIEILVYHKLGGEWGIYYSFDENDAGMMSADDYIHSDTVYCPGYVGGQFKIVTYFYAEDANGSDYRTLTDYVNCTRT